MPSVLDVRLGVPVPRTMISIERMLPMAEGDVRALYTRVRPTDPQKPFMWFWVNQTVLALDDSGVLGVTSFHIDQTGKLMTLLDTIVAPECRGQGIGQRLMDYRTSFGDLYGVKNYVGITAENNEPMKKILVATGFHACQRLPNYYADVDGIVYARGGV